MSKIPPKPRGSQRSVQTKIAGSSPELGRLSRISGHSEPETSSRRGSSRRSSRPTGTRKNDASVLRRWLMLILIAGGTVFCCMLMWSIFRQGNEPSRSSTRPGPGEATATVGIRPLTTEVALTKTRKLLEAKTPESLENLIRVGKIPPDQAVDILYDLAATHGPVQTPRWIGTIDTLALRVEGVYVRYEDGEDRMVAFTPNPNGDWEIDFDSFAQISEPPMAELASGQADEGEVRVIINRDTYFNGPYADESQWQCFALRTPKNEALIYGYCPPDSDVMRTLLAIEAKARMTGTTAGKDTANIRSSVILQIKRATNAANQQFEITSVISDCWVKPEVPLDEVIRARTAG